MKGVPASPIFAVLLSEIQLCYPEEELNDMVPVCVKAFMEDPSALAMVGGRDELRPLAIASF